MKGGALKLLTAIAMLAALVGVVAIAGWTQLNAYLARPGPATAETLVVLPRGHGVAAITGDLVDARVIDHPWLFRVALRVLDHDRQLQAGEYAFPAAVTPEQVISMLTRGETVARRLTVTEGSTVAEVFELIGDTEALTGPLPEQPPEGSLLPDTYFYSFGDTRAEVIRRMRKAMRQELEQLWRQRAANLPFETKEAALILASIVDKETAVSAERDKVAAVFVNRLRKGMRLQADPTVIYGLTNGNGPLDRPLTRRDWEHDSPYNTYQIDGLPPGPIANPGRASIEAVLNPADVDYLYFVADGSGGHAFARTLSEHNRNVANWRRVRDNGGAVKPSPAKPENAG